MNTEKIHSGKAESGKIERRGLMFVLSSPSGAGKTTLSRMLIRDVAGLRLSVSATTRPMRPGEVDGKDYHFVDATRFQTMINGGELLEWAKVSAGEDVLFDIDWQGTQQLRDKAAQDVVSVLILPPSVPDLEQRLRSRAQDSDDVIRNRMHKAGDEMSHWDAYDYIVINHEVDEAFDAVRAILFAERLKREQRHIADALEMAPLATARAANG